jgi:serine kinase of HPr protein (carbohydrate metabolism regulator)
VWVSSRRGYELLNLLQYHLAMALAPQVSLHGVFLEIFSVGVLITGETAAHLLVLDLVVPVFQLPVAAGRNLAVLTEAAVRLHMLRAKGLDPAAAFLARHATLLSLSQD